MRLFYTLCLIILVNGLSAQNTYSTIADGNWGSASTWKNGAIPSTTINYNNKVIITHNVVYNRSNDLDIRKGVLKIYEGELKFPTSGNGSGRTIFVKDDGELTVNSGKLIMPVFNSNGANASGNLYNEKGKISFNGSSIEIGQNWNSEDGQNTMVQSCIKVGENYKNDNNKDIMDRTCIEIGLHGSGNFDNDRGDIRVNLTSILLRGSSGNFKNKTSSSKIRKYNGSTMGFSVLDVPGDLENNGTWDAPINSYCIGDNIQGNRTWDIDFTAPENCTATNTANCDCSNVITNTSTWSQFGYAHSACELPEICSFQINFYFDSTINGVNIPWPDVNGTSSSNGNVTIGGFNYTEAESRAIFEAPNANGVVQASKKGFTVVATLKLSETNYSQEPVLLAAVNTVQLWLGLCGKLSPTNLPVNNVAVIAASNVIQNWIVANECPDRR